MRAEKQEVCRRPRRSHFIDTCLVPGVVQRFDATIEQEFDRSSSRTNRFNDCGGDARPKRVHGRAR